MRLSGRSFRLNVFNILTLIAELRNDPLINGVGSLRFLKTSTKSLS
jgi:hypothetical protein